MKIGNFFPDFNVHGAPALSNRFQEADTKLESVDVYDPYSSREVSYDIVKQNPDNPTYENGIRSSASDSLSQEHTEALRPGTHTTSANSLR